MDFWCWGNNELVDRSIEISKSEERERERKKNRKAHPKVGTIKLSKIGIPEEGRYWNPRRREIKWRKKKYLKNGNQEFSKIIYRHQNIDTRSSQKLKKDKYQCTHTCKHKHFPIHITLKLLKTQEKEKI